MADDTDIMIRRGVIAAVLAALIAAPAWAQIYPSPRYNAVTIDNTLSVTGASTLAALAATSVGIGSNASSAAILTLNGAAGSSRDVESQAAGVTAFRFGVGPSNNWRVARFSAGAFVDNPLTIGPTTGLVSIGQTGTSPNTLAVSRLSSQPSDDGVATFNYSMTGTGTNTGHINAPFAFSTTQPPGVEPGTETWNLFGYLSTEASTISGTQVALYSQAVRRDVNGVASGGVGAAVESTVLEMDDLTGYASSRAGGMRTLELNLRAVGPDDLTPGTGRIFLIMTGGYPTQTISGDPTYRATGNTEFGGLIRFARTNTTPVDIRLGFSGTGANITHAWVSSEDLTETSGARMIWLGDNHKIAFGASGNAYMSGDGTTINSPGPISIGNATAAQASLDLNAAAGVSKVTRYLSANVVQFSAGMGPLGNWNIGRYSAGSFVGNAIVVENSTGNITLTGTLIEPTTATPASAAASCTTGQHTWDTNYEYRCVGTNTWKRAALSTW